MEVSASIHSLQRSAPVIHTGSYIYVYIYIYIHIHIHIYIYKYIDEVKQASNKADKVTIPKGLIGTIPKGLIGKDTRID